MVEIWPLKNRTLYIFLYSQLIIGKVIFNRFHIGKNVVPKTVILSHCAINAVKQTQYYISLNFKPSLIVIIIVQKIGYFI